MSYRIPTIVISPIYDEGGNEIGKQYIDGIIDANDTYDFKSKVKQLVTDKQSIILYRQDVKQFAKRIECDMNTCNVFKSIKNTLRSEFTVFKLRHNPRTLEFYGKDTAFIIHKCAL